MRLMIMSILCGLLFSGCGYYQYVTAERLDRGLVIVLPGIEGRSRFNEAICDGLADGGVDWAIELYDWTTWPGPLFNLQAHHRNRRKAMELAARIVRYTMKRPDRPVVLVGQSGGGAIGVWTAEAVPPGEKIDGIIMLATSLSPKYTLDVALSNSRRGIVSFHSSRDWFFLGVGTAMHGTMDRRFGFSAGCMGFELPEDKARTGFYRKLFQIAWDKKMAEKGNQGLHLTSGAARFVSFYVAPLILADKWDRDLIERIVEGTAVRPEHKTKPKTSPAISPRPATRPALKWRPGSTTAPAR